MNAIFNTRDMENLKFLSIANNSLVSLGDRADITLAIQLSATSLILSGNKFTSMPEASMFEILPNLRLLDMSKNALSGFFNLSSISGKM